MVHRRRIVLSTLVLLIDLLASIFYITSSNDTNFQIAMLLFCLGIITLDILRGIFEKKIILGYVLIDREKDLKKWRFARLFNSAIWLAIIWLIIARS